MSSLYAMFDNFKEYLNHVLTKANKTKNLALLFIVKKNI